MTDQLAETIIDKWFEGESIWSLARLYDIDTDEIEQLIRDYCDVNK